jgi:hypothetical protein
MAGARSFRYFAPDSPGMTPPARWVEDEDIDALEAARGRAWSPDVLVRVVEGRGAFDELLVLVAVAHRKRRAVEYLVSVGAPLNRRKKAALPAAGAAGDADLVDYLLAHGARIGGVNAVGANAMMTAVQWGHAALLPHLEARGLAVDADGGAAFVAAASRGEVGMVRFFLSRGIDPNLRPRTMVDPQGWTALHAAAGKGDPELVRLLLDHGADPMIEDDRGERPRLVAARRGKPAVAALLAGREPAALRDPDRRAAWLAERGVPAELIAFLRGPDRRLTFDSRFCAWMDLLPVADVYERRLRGRTYVMLWADCDDRCCLGELAWAVERGRLALVDEEHGRVAALGSWTDFRARPEVWIDRSMGVGKAPRGGRPAAP